ncbi:hypothetical protein J8V57_19935 [Xenorhabdus sp. PB61.4]|uniref:DUF7706 family protein n=1 Tax=Xenorhabdus sp. PB61.4 TaxID=2788940 RepID=UPI001E4FAD2B|nr:hypothetical protein [Xenorhabdus sp. PB61.4]MCC8368455.1 hypothetical protein [Xenorhabdus sp. PB61.4]
MSLFSPLFSSSLLLLHFSVYALPGAFSHGLSVSGRWSRWAELRACAVSDDDAYKMKDAIHKLQNALAEAGFAPQGKIANVFQSKINRLLRKDSCDLILSF